MKFSNLKIGFMCDVKPVAHHQFEVTGDICVDVDFEDSKQKKTYGIDRLFVSYNHDGLLEDVLVDDKPDALRLFRDVEMYVNGCWNASAMRKMTEDLNDGVLGFDTKDVQINGDSSIDVYADFNFWKELK